MRTQQEIKEGLEKSEKMFEKYFGDLNNLKLDFNKEGITKSLKKWY